MAKRKAVGFPMTEPGLELAHRIFTPAVLGVPRHPVVRLHGDRTALRHETAPTGQEVGRRTKAGMVVPGCSV